MTGGSKKPDYEAATVANSENYESNYCNEVRTWSTISSFSSSVRLAQMMMLTGEEEEEAAVRAAFDARRASLREKELLEITSLRIKHATEVERLQHRICTAALGVKGQEQARFTPTI